MTCFIDSSVLIAFADVRDENHARSVELLKKAFNDKTFGTIYTSDYVFDECVTFTYARTKDKQKALQLGQHLLSSEIELIYTTSSVFEKAWNAFKTTKGLSFTDCILIATMQTYGIKHLLTFDNTLEMAVKTTK